MNKGTHFIGQPMYGQLIDFSTRANLSNSAVGKKEERVKTVKNYCRNLTLGGSVIQERDRSVTA